MPRPRSATRPTDALRVCKAGKHGHSIHRKYVNWYSKNYDKVGFKWTCLDCNREKAVKK